MRRLITIATFLAMNGVSGLLYGAGEAVKGFPSWEERLLHEWTNRARVAPDLEYAACGTANCVEPLSCYPAMPPLGYQAPLNEAARFHSAFMLKGGAFAHDSSCALRADIAGAYPDTCDGSPSCACSGTGTTAWSTRISRFGASPRAENLAYGFVPDHDVNFLFYFLLYEKGDVTTCTQTAANGHRWNIFKNNGGAIGNGWATDGVRNYLTQDFGNGVQPAKIVSAAHYPRQAPTVEVWANWYDPSITANTMSVHVNGVAHVMTLARGTANNGAWRAVVPAVGSGCHRYYIQAIDSLGQRHRYPTTGTYGIGTAEATCPDYRPAAPADFNGNGISDKVVYSHGAWLYFSEGASIWTGENPTCIPAPGDFDGDGADEMSMFCDGGWHFFRRDGTYIKGIWMGGGPGVVPVPADFDGDGADEPVLYNNGAWTAFNYTTGAVAWSRWTGGAGAIPLAMDFDGDRRAEFSNYLNGAWHFYNDDGSYLKGILTGHHANNIPVPGDYDGDVIEEPVIFRDGQWHFFNFATGAYVRSVSTPATSVNGEPLQPTPLDYDGDGTVDFGIFAGGPWHFYNDSGSYRDGVWVGTNPGSQAISRRQHVNP